MPLRGQAKQYVLPDFCHSKYTKLRRRKQIFVGIIEARSETAKGEGLGRNIAYLLHANIRCHLSACLTVWKFLEYFYNENSNAGSITDGGIGYYITKFGR